jgi:hypothetical protein
MTRVELRRYLRTIKDAEWAIAETASQSFHAGNDGARATWEIGMFEVTIHRAFPTGSGSAVARWPSNATDIAAKVQQLADACAEQIRPPWRGSPQSAAAQVKLSDDDEVSLAVVDRMMASLAAASAKASADFVRSSVDISLVNNVVETSSGNEMRWTQTRFGFDLLARRGAHEVTAQRRAIRRHDLLAEQSITAVADELDKLQSAVKTPRQRTVVVLDQHAMLFDGVLGVWQALADHGELQRQARGLSRLSTVISGSTLRLVSDGAREYGWLSAPVASDGAPVRQFNLLQGGALVALGSDVATAGLAHTIANGGVRNLLVEDVGQQWRSPSSYLVVHRLSDPQLDGATGTLTAAIAHASLIHGDSRQTVAGGCIRIDLIERLITARMTGDMLETAAFRGRSSVAIGEVNVV